MIGLALIYSYRGVRGINIFPWLLQQFLKKFSISNFFYIIQIACSQVESVDQMNKKSKKMMIRLGVNGQQPSEGECEGRLQSIVKTFRQNNLKLMQQIQECNRKRELQQEINIRRANQKVPFDKLQDYLAKRYCNSSTSQRPFSQFKTERKLNMNQEDRFKKQNLAIEPNSRLAYKKSQDCSEYQFESQSDKNLKLVKINMKKLVPLTIDRLKERIKML